MASFANLQVNQMFIIVLSCNKVKDLNSELLYKL